MHCPKCNFEQNVQNAECEKCGVYFAKYYSSLEVKSKASETKMAHSSPEDTDPQFSFGELFFYTKPESNIFSFVGRLFIFVGTILLGIKFIASPIESNSAGNSFLHLVNLPFHETGHIVFRPFGSFITSLGGTISQLMMPMICFSVLLLKTRDTFGSSVTLWWFGENFFDIAPYVNDARSLTMPLVGGNFGHSSPYGFHDWEYLLTESGLLQYDHFLAHSFMAIGTVILIISFVWGGILLFKQYKNLF
ncbi:MAG: zinc ribbon domain-containing protein [Proteobacteria bacterium]|nr:zinc ribbon domain-containing protein [Pseudomonadota bacterium]